MVQAKTKSRRNSITRALARLRSPRIFIPWLSQNLRHLWPDTVTEAIAAMREVRISRQRLRRPERQGPRVEILEPRLLLSSVSWIAPTGGDWGVGTNWSTGTVPVSGDTAIIASLNPGSQVTYNTGNSTVAAVQASSPLEITGGTLTVTGSTQITGTTLILDGGTLADTTLSTASGGVIQTASGSTTTLDAATLNSSLAISSGSTLDVADGLTMGSGATITIDAGGTLNFVDGTSNTQTVSGSGTITLAAASGSYAASQLNANGANAGSQVTLDSGVNITGLGSSTAPNTITSASGNTIVFDDIVTNASISSASGGALQANSATFQGTTLSGPLSIASGTMTLEDYYNYSTGGPDVQGVNAGIINIASGATLDLSNYSYNLTSSWTNASGTINIAGGGTLNLGGDFTQSDLGTINNSAGIINFSGILTNTGGNLSAALLNSWTPQFGAVVGGTVSAPGDTVTLSSGNLYLDGVTLQGTVSVNGGSLRLEDYYNYSTNTDTIGTNDAIINIASGGYLGLSAYYYGSASTWTNAGTVNIASGGALGLGGDFTQSDLGTINSSGGSIDFSGTLMNTGENLSSALLDSWTMDGGTVIGGTVGATSDTITLSGSSGLYFEGTTLQGTINIASGTVTLEDYYNYNTSGPDVQGVNAGAINIASGATLYLSNYYYGLTDSWTNASGTVNIASGGTLNIGGYFTQSELGTINNSGGTIYFSGTLTNTGATISAASLNSWTMDGGTIIGGTVGAVGNTITLSNNFGISMEGVTLQGAVNVNSGSLYFQDYYNSSTGTDTIGANDATINIASGAFVGMFADYYGATADNWTNASGTVNVASGGTLNLGGNFTTTDTGTINSSGTIDFSGKLTNTSNTVATALLNSWTMQGGTITGGIIGASGQTVNLTGYAVTLDGVTISSNLTVASGTTLNIADNLTLGSGATITVDAGGTLNFVDGTSNAQSVSGSGTIALDAASGSYAAGQINAAGANAGSSVTFSNGVNISGPGLVYMDTGNSAMFGDVVTGATLSASGGEPYAQLGAGEFHAAVFDTVTVASNVYLAGNGTLDIQDGLKLQNGAAIEDDANSNLVFTNGASSTQTISGSGSILLPGSAGGLTGVITFAGSGSTVTVASGVAISGYGVVNAASGDTLVLSDTVQLASITASSGGTLSLDGATLLGTSLSGDISVINAATTMESDGSTVLINNATVVVSSGATLYTTGSWTNQSGSITADGGTVSLGGTFNTATADQISNNSGAIIFTGTLDGTGTTISAALLNQWTADWGTIDGGTIGVTGGTTDFSLTNSQRIWLTDVTLNTGLDINSGSWVYLQSNLTLAGGATVSVVGGILHFWDWSTGTTSATGNGSIVISSGSYVEVDGGTATIGNGVIVEGAGSLGDDGVNSSLLVNQGTIEADKAGETLNIGEALQNNGIVTTSNGGDLSLTGASLALQTGGSLTVNAGSTVTLGSGTYVWSNAGTITVASGGTLNLGGNFATAGIGTINSSGTIDFSGKLNNAASTLSASILNTWTMNGGTITGGTIGSSGTTVNLSGSNVTFDGSTLASSLTVETGTTLNIADGLTLANGATMTVDAGGTLNFVDGTGNIQTVSGTGAIVLDAASGSYAAGQINANGVNAGSSVTFGGGVSITGLGTAGSPNNIHAASGNTAIFAGSITNVTVSASSGGYLIVAQPWQSTYAFDAVTVASNLTIQAGDELDISDGMTLANNATIFANGAYRTIHFVNGTSNTQTLSGTGNIQFYTSGTVYASGMGVWNASSVVTLGSGITISGAGYIAGTVGAILINYGTIEAPSINAHGLAFGETTLENYGTIAVELNSTLDVGVTNIVNEIGGTISVAAGGELDLNTNSAPWAGNWSNAGMITVASGGTLNLGGNFTTAGIGTINSSGTVDFSGKLNNAGSTLSASTLGSWTMNGGTITGGTIGSSSTTVNLTGSSVTFDGSILDSNVTVSAVTTLNIADGLTVANGATITVDAGGTLNFIDGASNIQTASGSGTIALDAASGSYAAGQINANGANVGSQVTFANGVNITGQGSLNVGSGNTLALADTVTGASITASAGAGIQLYAMTLQNGVMNINPNATLTLENDNQYLINSSLNNSGVVNVISGLWVYFEHGASITNAAGGVFTITNDDWFQPGVYNDPSSMTFNNAGILNINTPAQYLRAEFLPAGNADVVFNNTGTVNVTAGTLQLGDLGGNAGQTGASWSNAGTVTVGSGGLLDLGGNFTTAGIGTINSSGTIDFSGKLNNAAGTLSAGTLNTWIMNGGTITGGTIGSSGTTVNLTGSGVTFDGATLDSNITVSAGTRLNIADNLTLANGATITVDAGGSLNFIDGTSNIQTVSGSGTITLDAASGSLAAGELNANGANIGSQVTFDYGVNITGLGTSTAPNTITAASGNTIAFDDGVTQVTITAASGGVLQADGANFLGVTLTGTLDVNSGIGYLNGVTVAADITIASGATLWIENGLTFQNGASVTTQSGGILRLPYTEAVNGTGRIVLAAESYTYHSYGTLTFGSGITLAGAGQMWSVDDAPLINQGTIDANVSGQTLAITLALRNDGTITTSNSGNLAITGPGFTLDSDGSLTVNTDSTVTLGTTGASWSNAGAINISGGTLDIGGSVTTADLGLSNWHYTAGQVEITGVISNAAATLALSPTTTGATVMLDGATIDGGTITTAGGAALTTAAGTASELDGAILDSNITVVAGSTLNIADGLTLGNGATITVDAGGTLNFVDGTSNTQSVSGSGTITLDAASGSYAAAQLNANGANSGSQVTFANGVEISGTGAGTTESAVTADANNTIVFDNAVTNTAVSAATGGYLQADGSYSAPAIFDGVTILGNLTLQSSAALGIQDGLTLAQNVTLNVGTATLEFQHGSTLGQSVSLASGAAAATIQLGGNGAYSNGTFMDNDSFGPLTIASGVTINGAASITVASGGTLVNQGTLVAGNSQTLNITGSFTNEGTLQTLGDGQINIPTGTSSGTFGASSSWTDMNVGNSTSSEASGIATDNLSANSWTVSSSSAGMGTGISGAADQFNFAGQNWTGDGSLTFQVSGETAGAADGQAGVMFRDSGAPGSLFAAVTLTADNAAEFQWRASTGGQVQNTQVSNAAGVSGALWVKLTRSGNSFIGYYSTDGTTWTQIGAAQTIGFTNTSILAGMAVAAGGGAANTATFTGQSTVWSSATTLSGDYTVAPGEILTIADGLDLAGYTLTVDAGGTIDVTGGTIDSSTGAGSMILLGAGNWSGGTISTPVTVESDATLNITSTVTLSGTTLNNDGGWINLNGLLNSSGATLLNSSTAGSWTVNGTILGGTISGSDAVNIVGSNLTLQDMLLSGTVNLAVTNADMQGITVTHGSTLNVNSATVTFEDYRYYSASSGSYEDAPGANDGTINIASGAELDMAYVNQGPAPSWTNASGTINIATEGTLSLGGYFTTSGIGAITSTGGETINFSGTLNNSGNTNPLLWAAIASWNMEGGTITGGYLGASGENAALSVASGGNLGSAGLTLQGVQLAGNVTLSSGFTLTVEDGLTLDNATINVGGGSALQFEYDPANPSAGQTLRGTGTINLGSMVNGNYQGGNIYDADSSGVLIIGGSVTIQGAGNIGTVVNFFGGSAETLDNEGTIDANIVGQELDLGYGELNWNNSYSGTPGTIKDNGGVLKLDGTFLTANLGSLEYLGGQIVIAGIMTINGVNDTFTLSPTTTGSTLLLDGGTIQEGTLAATGGALLEVGSYPGGGSASGTLAGVTLDTGLTIGSGTVTLEDYYNGTTTPVTEVQGINDAAITVDSGATLTLGAMSSTYNYGTAGPWTNASGTININTGGVLNLAGDFAPGDLGTITNAGGTINLTGTLDNSSGTLAPAMTGSWTSGGGTVNFSGTLNNSGTSSSNPLLWTTIGAWNMAGGMITGGYVGANGETPTLIGSGATLAGVQMTGNATLSSGFTLTVEDGLTLGNATINVGGGSTLQFVHDPASTAAGQTLGGSGTIQLGGMSAGGYTAGLLSDGDASGTLTIAGGITVQGAGQIASAGGYWLVVNGIINADITDSTLAVGIGLNWSSSAPIEDNGGILDLEGSFSTASLGLLSYAGGQIELSGGLDNTSTAFTLSLNTTGATLLLTGGTINGGTISASGGADMLAIANTTSTLDAVSLGADVTVNSQATLDIQDGLTFQPASAISALAGARIGLSDSNGGYQTISGSGQIILTSNSGGYAQIEAAAFTPGSTVAFADGVTISGSGDISAGVGNTIIFDNNVQGATLSSSGGYLQVGGTSSNPTVFSGDTLDGNLTLNANSVLDVENGMTEVAGVSINQDAGSRIDMLSGTSLVNSALQSWAGNGAVTAQVTGFTGTNSQLAGGVTFLDSGNPGAALASVMVSNSGSITFQWIASDGATLQSTLVTGATVPVQVRLVRWNNTVSAYYSYSTVESGWTQIGTSENVAFSNSTILAGLSMSDPAGQSTDGVLIGAQSLTSEIPADLPQITGTLESANENQIYTLNLASSNPSNITGWSINWGDGTAVDSLPGTASSDTHSYAADIGRQFMIAVSAMTTTGQAVVAAPIIVSVVAVTPLPIISGSGDAGEGQPYTLTLSPTTAAGDGVTSWSINWGDGTAIQYITGSPASVSHIFAVGTASTTVSASATDVNGTGIAAQAVTITPASPTNLTVAGVTDTSVTLGWTDNSVIAQTMIIEDSMDGGVTYTPAVYAASSATTTTVTNLLPNQSYSFQVIAASAYAQSTPAVSDTVSATTDLASPTNFAASAVSATEIDLSWTAAAGATGYTVEQSTDYVTWSALASLPASVASYNDTSVTGAGPYYYQLIAIGPSGNNSAPATTGPIYTPFGV